MFTLLEQYLEVDTNQRHRNRTPPGNLFVYIICYYPGIHSVAIYYNIYSHAYIPWYLFFDLFSGCWECPYLYCKPFGRAWKDNVGW